ncbi:Mobile element protein [Klebsiella pneumoniae IS22]|nr:Mobile element protein [Klebsiella pneumoniae IS22]
MAKPKYSPETKLAVVNHYLSGKDGEQSTATFLVLKEHLSVAGSGHGSSTVQKA